MVIVRNITEINDFKQLRDIQQSAWGFGEEETEPHHLMTRVQKYGGLVQGLWLDDKMVGFSYAVPGRWEGEFFLYSHMLAVIRELQSQGYGFVLKKAQREEALKMGYSVIRWNFDPLESLNTYFNIHRLGAVSVEYERDIYGVGESGLHKGLPTDRLIATWRLDSDRVARRMESKIPSLVERVPSDRIGDFSGEVTYVEIPKNIREIKMRDLSEALNWRIRTREMFEDAFRKGYTVTEIVFSEDRERVFCKLERANI